MSVELGAVSVALETVASDRTAIGLGPFAGLMAAVHVPIGLVEGAVTAAAATLLWRLRPAAPGEALASEGRAAWRRTVTGVGLAAAVAAGVLAWFASARPDGLEWSLARSGATTESAAAAAPAPAWPVVSGRTSAEGLGGAVVVLLVSVGIGLAALLLRRRRAARPVRP